MGQRRPSRAEFQEPGERSASAPQVCICDAMQNWGSMHVSAELQMNKGARDDNLQLNVGRARESNC
eukprot:5186908-Pleurochrysis_carterae.AAC.1